jgi:hypothetical protein
MILFTAPWRLVEERLLRLPLLKWNVNFTAECVCFFVALKIFDEAQKQDQSCILAQFFWSCENLRLELFPRASIHEPNTPGCQVPRK